MQFGGFGGGSKDQPFIRVEDYKAFTWALVLAYYRPWQLIRKDNEQKQTVWAKTKEDVLRYAAGEVTPISMAKGLQVMPTAVIVISEEDGGYINEHGLIKDDAPKTKW